MSFRILHWGVAARQFLKALAKDRYRNLYRNSTGIDRQIPFELSLAGIDLASIYKRNLVGKLDAYPETVKVMNMFWDEVGLTGISSLTEPTAYPMTEEEIIEALGRINKHLDEHEESRRKGVSMRALYWFKLVQITLKLKEELGYSETSLIDKKVTELYYGWLDLIKFEDNYPETTRLFKELIDTSSETTAYVMLSDEDAMCLVRSIKTDLRHYGYQGDLSV